MNKIKGSVAVLAFAILMFFVLPAGAQKSAIYTDRNADFRQGLDLFEKKQFASAQSCFIRTSHSQTDKHTLLCSESDYYAALCAMELFHKDAEYLLKKFILDYPESPRVRAVYFNLGKYNYRKKVYKDAIDWFNKVEVYDLNEEEKSEFYFKRGYSLLEKDSSGKAKNDFAEIKDKDTKYSPPASYYHAHILYSEKNYESALLGFQKLEKDATFGAVVPYYIAQIYYLQHKYEDVIAYAPALLDSASTKRAPELARILGESFFKTGKFKESIPYLERYHKSSALNRSDSYELGFAYYMMGDYDPAIASFKEVVGVGDSLAQNTWYHLGDCYLKKSNKYFAQNAFEEASRLHFDRGIREDALFNFAELTYELSFSPFNEAIKALQQYISEYPNSPRSDEAYAYLVKINLVTKNYEDALKSIESIKTMKEILKPVYQQIAYNRGVELYNNFNFEAATAHFSKALKYPIDPVTNALSRFWTAEATYQLAEKRGDKALYETASEEYKAYQEEPGAPLTRMYNALQYNIGYARFQLNDYPQAITAFRKYVMQKAETPEKICNAYIRIGDCYYVTKDFSNAADYYDQAFNTKTGKKSEKDYALYQEAMALGIEKKYDAKVSKMLSLLNMYPVSTYGPATKYELAHTYQLMNKPGDAITYYKKLIAENNGSAYVRKSYAQLGLIYYNQNDLDNALASYQKLVRTDKNSDEAKDAQGQIRQIYIDRKDPDGLIIWDQSQGFNIATSAYDSIAFNAAKVDYTAGNCNGAVSAFAKYIQKYPSGIFILSANFMKAECDLKNSNLDAALGGYNYILSQPQNEFTENSLRRAAAICFNRNDFKPAYDNYAKLETNPQYANDARVGMMRAAWGLKDYENAPVAANKVLTTDNVSPELAGEAHYIIARSAMEKQNYDLAFNEYSITQAGSKNERGAEAAYNCALIQYIRKDYKKAEKDLFDIIKQQAGYKNWVGKSFLLLSDNYLALNDTFHAKLILKNFIDHTDIPELKVKAQEKLTNIETDEKTKEKGKTEKEVTVPGNNERDKKLFEDEKKGGNPQ